MKHLNRNLMVAIAIRTTGPYSYHHDIAEVSAIVVNSQLEMHPEYTPFNMYIQPTRLENIDWEELKLYKIEDNNLDYRQFKLNKRMLETYITKGVESSYAGDLFIKWFENLCLRRTKKIMPLVYDWSFSKPFFVDWLGKLYVDIIFDQRYRDLKVCSLFMNDRAGYRCDIHMPFAKNNFRYLCSQMKVELIDENNTLHDAYAMIEVYRRMCKTFW